MSTAAEVNQRMGDTSEGMLRIERLLPGPIERVWAFLTEPDKRMHWLAAGPMDLREGGAYALKFDNNHLSEEPEEAPEEFKEASCGNLSGSILRCEAPHLLEFSWGTAPDASQVRFELSEEGDQVRLRLTHHKISKKGEQTMVSSGWHAHLAVLVERLEGKTPQGFWSRFEKLRSAYQSQIEH